MYSMGRFLRSLSEMVRVLPVPVGPMHSTWESVGSGPACSKELGFRRGVLQVWGGTHRFAVGQEHLKHVGHAYGVHGGDDNIAVVGVRHHGEGR